MHKVTIDATVQAKLGDLSRQFEIYDESGQRLGFYVPAPTYDPALYDWVASQFSQEELRRRGGTGRPDHRRSLATPGGVAAPGRSSSLPGYRRALADRAGPPLAGAFGHASQYLLIFNIPHLLIGPACNVGDQLPETPCRVSSAEFDKRVPQLLFVSRVHGRPSEALFIRNYSGKMVVPGDCPSPVSRFFVARLDSLPSANYASSLRVEKGTSPICANQPCGPFRQIGPVPFPRLRLRLDRTLLSEGKSVESKRIFLSEKELPTAWYNLQADLPTPLPPPLHPGTKQPLSARPIWSRFSRRR